MHWQKDSTLGDNVLGKRLSILLGFVERKFTHIRGEIELVTVIWNSDCTPEGDLELLDPVLSAYLNDIVVSNATIVGVARHVG